MLNTYLDQLEQAATQAGVDLRDACKLEGIAQTTLWRWRHDRVAPREGTAKSLYRRIQEMANE